LAVRRSGIGNAVPSNNTKESGSKDQGSIVFVVLISCIATIGGFLFGFDSGVINGTVDGLQQAFDSDSVGTGFNVASMLLGCAVGAFFAGRFADRHGRRFVLRVAAVFFIVSAWGSGIADTSPEFVFYRVLGGLAVGAASILAPAYISEVTPAHNRGALSTLQQVAIISGLFVAFLSNYLIAGAAGSSVAVAWLGFEAWRWMFWVEIVPATIFFLALLLIPESPRYLVLIRRHELALEVLTSLSGRAVAIRKVEEISASLDEDRRQPRFSDLRDPGSGRVRRIVWVGLGLAALQQLVGINVVFYYGAVLWQAVGFTESDALAINMLGGALSISAVTATILLVDRIGRKPILFIGSVGMAVSLVLLTYTFSHATTGVSGALTLEGWFGPMALIAANVYVVFFNFSWGPVMWVMLGEMFPNQIRGAGLAVSGLVQWGSNFAITMTFPILLASIGLAGAYSFYTVCAFLSIAFVTVMVRETRGIELEDMGR
jgi:SP family sugar:H+ symporter-like MFS transporter